MRRLICGLFLAILLAPLAADAQQAGKVYRIGFLSLRPPLTSPSPFDQALRELGWMEGQNLAFERRYAEGKLEQLPHLAAELVRLKVDVIVALATPAARAAKQATSTIPIVGVNIR